MSLRRLRVLVSHLPDDSATARAIRGHGWTTTTHLIADLVDLLQYHRAEFLSAHGATPARPEPVPRPGVSREDKRKAMREAHDIIMSTQER